MRNGCLQTVKAIVKRKQCMLPESDTGSFFLLTQYR